MSDDLTHSQLQISIGQRLHPGAPLYNMAFAFVFAADAEPLDLETFRLAWRRVAGASDALRSLMVRRPGGGIARSHELGPTPETQVVKLEAADESLFLQWAQERCAQTLPIDATLADSVLVPLSDGGVGWYLNQHHLVTDAASTQLLYRLVAEQYAKLRDGEDGTVELPGYVETYRRQLERARVQPPVSAPPSAQSDSRSARAVRSAEDHWQTRRTQAGRRIELYGRGGAEGTESVRLTLELGKDRSAAFERLSRTSGFASLSPELSRFGVMATLLSAYLHRMSGGGRELGFDTPVAGRTTADAKRTPGLFIELFPFAVEVRPGDTFRALGARCLEEAMRFLRHARPGLSAPSGAEAHPVVLNFIPTAFGDFAGRTPRVEWLHPGHGDSVHALRVQAHDLDGRGLTLCFDWNERALPARLRHRSLRHFEALLEAALADPDREIASVDVRTEDEREPFATGRDVDEPPLPDRTVVDLFSEQARRTPDRVALRQIKDGQAVDELTFAALSQRVDARVAALRQQGLQPGDRVALLGTRTIDTVVSILAILRARAAYVPIDPDAPPARREHMLEDSGARLWLGDALQADLEPSSNGAWHLPREGARHLPTDRPRLGDVAYLLYTSGSTGRPKGVLVEHGALSDYLGWARRRYVRGARLTFPLFTSLSFDLTVTSLFLPLLTGGTLELYPRPDGPVDSALLDVVRRNAVDFLKLTPSHLSLLRRTGLRGSRVRRMVVGGEDLKASLAAAISSQLDDQLEIHNEYGPTEAIVGCIAHRFDPTTDRTGSVPIGAPADHVEIDVLDAAGCPVPEGVPGELWIARADGPHDRYHGLARGYHNLPTLTAERFLADASGLRRYRTGDKVRLVRPGMLEFLGRLDRQVKVSGFRIEPGEIESVLSDLPGITECAVVAQRSGVSDARAVAAETQELRHCRRCGLPSNYPRATIGADGVCSICHTYDRVCEHAQAYFRTMDDLTSLVGEARRQHPDAPFDCIMLYSGGKDSTYALCRLAEMDLRVLAFSLDNGYISDGAKRNIRRVTEQLGV
ncbi:MAG: amino acid adenylation domain-containing protein, partial [Acidobacteriota bacterium]